MDSGALWHCVKSQVVALVSGVLEWWPWYWCGVNDWFVSTNQRTARVTDDQLKIRTFPFGGGSQEVGSYGSITNMYFIALIWYWSITHNPISVTPLLDLNILHFVLAHVKQSMIQCDITKEWHTIVLKWLSICLWVRLEHGWSFHDANNKYRVNNILNLF